MNTFIKLLPLELSEVKEFLEPNSELSKDDHEAGVMSEDLRKLYTLWNNTMKSEALIAAERKFGRVDNEEEYDAKLEELVDRMGILERLFWFSVKVEHNLWGKNIGVRKGFIVVWSDREPSFEDFIHRFFEGR